MARILLNTRFLDVAKRENVASAQLLDERAKLSRLADDKKLTSAQEAKLAELDAIEDERVKSAKNNNKHTEVLDPLFVATRTLLNANKLLPVALRSQEAGVLGFDTSKTSDPANPTAEEKESLIKTALTFGLLQAEGAVPPPVTVVGQQSGTTGVKASGTAHGKTLYPDEGSKRYAEFTQEFFEAVGEAASYGQLAEDVFSILSLEGDPDGPGGDTYEPVVDAEEFAKVLRGLKDRGIHVTVPQLRRRVNEVLDEIQNVGSRDSIALTGIELPDLDNLADQNIVRENIRVMGPMIVSAMFEELKVFQVVDRIVEQFQRGMLPVGSGSAGRLLYNYWREAPNRMSEQERRDFQTITLGVPGGNPNALVNRDFNDLWIRFVSSVSSYVRQNDVDTLLRSSVPGSISQQQVRKAARDLAANLTLHGYGMAHYAAREIQAQVSFVIKLLQDKEILAAYGARDMWQVIDHVATYDLGGAKTSSRYRTLATCGTIIIEWLAKRAKEISKPTGMLINLAEVRSPIEELNHRATVNPSDYDLVNACELWLADTATSDSQIEELSQPREAPTTTSKPIPIPAMAQDMLDGMGIGLSNNAGRGMMWTRH